MDMIKTKEIDPFTLPIWIKRYCLPEKFQKVLTQLTVYGEENKGFFGVRSNCTFGKSELRLVTECLRVRQSEKDQVSSTEVSRMLRACRCHHKTHFPITHNMGISSGLSPSSALRFYHLIVVSEHSVGRMGWGG
ncbi:hypothetical protein RRG08_042291 [Elysia crispata]|uniref:Uncharacterized protein n=1 Tax=Elysia crispata TaxID=231223 RepID=A0AAE1AHZ3_9GAST|nr:hypothetical protein RRG08_042291 [Elysia crispata]